MTKKGYSPVRIEKIEEARKILEIINEGDRQQRKSNYKPPSMLQTLYNLFIDGRDSLEDGLSIKEIALILSPDVVTIEEMIAGKSNYNLYYNTIYPLLKNTKAAIARFRKWKGNKEIVLYPRQTPTGKWLYYRIRDMKEFEEVKLRLAKISLGYDKQLQGLEEIVSMRKEEREQREKEFLEQMHSEIDERQKRREIRKQKEKQKVSNKIRKGILGTFQETY